MANTSLQQKLISMDEIIQATPNWTPEAREDYFNFKSDLTYLISRLIADFQYVAYGGLRLSAPAAFSNINATWKTIDVFDSISFQEPVHVTQDLAGSALAADSAGVYEFTFNISLTHDESNSGRTIYLRVYNTTKDVATGVLFPVAIGRNQPGTNISYSVPVEASSEFSGDLFTLQLGNGDTLASVTFQAVEYYVKSIGEFRGNV